MGYKIHTNKTTKPMKNIEFIEKNYCETLEKFSLKYTSKQQQKFKQWYGFTF
jgi:hypothetical protein